MSAARPLMMIQQLVLSPNGTMDMGTLLGLMHFAPPTELQLKTDILRVSLRSVSFGVGWGIGTFIGWYLLRRAP